MQDDPSQAGMIDSVGERLHAISWGNPLVRLQPFSEPRIHAVACASPMALRSARAVQKAAFMLRRHGDRMQDAMDTRTMLKASRSAALCLLALAAVACQRPADAVPEETVEAPVAGAAKQPAATSSPRPDRPSPAVAADAKPALRFDMTQDGEAMTADRFDEWLDERGVRVAAGASEPAAKAAGGTETGIKTSVEDDKDAAIAR